ncbi:glutaredoxin domain-containing protein [Pseudoclavibacter helvolus]|uniref:glutaredoxin domain-containing protein n=1 Tax=Pseudoclavibacter helvolus TaxID=255205 RepID=UPI0035F0DD98
METTKTADPITDVIRLYTKPNCVQCKMVKRHLNIADVRFIEEEFTDESIAAAKALGYASAPLTVRGSIIVAGFHPDALNALIEGRVL